MHRFHDSALADLAALAARLDARMEGDDDDGGATLAEKLGEFFDGATGTTGGDDDEGDSSGTEATNDDGFEGEEQDEPDDSDEPDDDEGGDESDEEKEGEGDEDEESDEATDEDEEEEEEESDDADEEEPSEFERAAARSKLPTDFSDILKSLPKEARGKARQAFERRLGQMEAGFTRTMQQAATFRQERATMKADLDWITKNPLDFIFERFDKDPKLIDQFNEEIEARESSKGYQKETQLRRERTKAEAKQAAEKAEAEADKRQARVNHVEGLARQLCARAGISYEDAVEEALYAQIVSSPTRDISDEDIRAIVERKARVFKKLTGEKRRTERKEWVKAKVKDRQDAKKRITARDRGHAPAPGRRDESKLSLEQKMLRSAARIAPDMPEG